MGMCRYSGLLCAVASGFAVGFASAPAQAAVIHDVSAVSAKGVPVTFEAHLTITGDTLTIELINSSAQASLNPDDLLSSYYFDIVDGSSARPSLAYVSGTGDVWMADKSVADTLHSAGADLRATAPGDYTWAFGSMDPGMSPFLGFGLGTVGNSNLAPNNFNGSVVDGIDYSIYAGDVTTANLDGKLLVKGSATFVFSGVSGFSESDISGTFAFGLGTAPDSLIPGPGTAGLVVAGAGVMLRRRRR